VGLVIVGLGVAILEARRESTLELPAVETVALHAPAAQPNRPSRGARSAPSGQGGDRAVPPVPLVVASGTRPPAPLIIQARATERRKPTRRRPVEVAPSAGESSGPETGELTDNPSNSDSDPASKLAPEPTASLAWVAVSARELALAVATPPADVPPAPAAPAARAVSDAPERAARDGAFRETAAVLQEAPRFPARARRRGVRSGNVEVDFTIDRTGVVRDAVVVQAMPPDIFDEVALEAVRRWRYSPRIKAGVPVDRHNVQVRLLFSEPR